MTDQQRTSILASKVHCVRYRFTTVATVTSDRLVGIDDSTVIFVVRRDGAGHNQRVGMLFRVRRLAVVLVLLPLALSVAPVPASAHPSGSNPDAAYYQADLAEITPARPDVVVRVDPRGEWIDLTYTGDTEVVVLGYTGEPYLRVTATTTAENLVSQTTYLNKAMFADIPTSGRTASAAPTWQPIDGAGTVRWHDHRIHWMGQARPPNVAADPTRRHLVGTWVVHAVAGTVPFDIRGTLNWIGKPNGLPLRTWLILALANLPFVIGAIVWRLRRPRHVGVRPDLERVVSQV
jgi:hypothetical protein